MTFAWLLTSLMIWRLCSSGPLLKRDRRTGFPKTRNIRIREQFSQRLLD
jgi:hypothetical protein